MAYKQPILTKGASELPRPRKPNRGWRSPMEDDDQLQPPPLPMETLDLIVQKKHAVMLERLSNLRHSRLQQSAADSSSPSFESVRSFLSRFADAKLSVKAELRRCRALAASDPVADKSQIKPLLDKVSSSISDLENQISVNSYFLPPYELRSSLKAVGELKEMLESANAELLPRKKFSFKSKSSSSSSYPSKKDPFDLPKAAEDSIVPDAAKLIFDLSDSPGFRNMKSEILVKCFRVSEDFEGDFSIEDLDCCDVYLKGRCRALFIHRLKKCRIFGGPVLGSILIEEVSDCLFMLASHQIRIHEAGECDFYLRLRSRPIVEYCRGVRFAPYRLFYEGIDKDLRDSDLEEDTGNWANVDDFRWLRAVQSPNWCLIPEEEFVDVRDASALEEKLDSQ